LRDVYLAIRDRQEPTREIKLEPEQEENLKLQTLAVLAEYEEQAGRPFLKEEIINEDGTYNRERERE